jgi:hypothetical protein
MPPGGTGGGNGMLGGLVPDASVGGAGGVGSADAAGASGGSGAAGAGGRGGQGRDAARPDTTPPAVNLAPFVGTWEATTGVEIWDCDVTGPSTEPRTGPFRLEMGVDAPLWEISEPCTFRLDVSGSTATYRTTPSCTFADGESSYVVTPLGGTILVSGADAVIMASFMTLVREPGLTQSCQLQVEGRARRVR